MSFVYFYFAYPVSLNWRLHSRSSWFRESVLWFSFLLIRHFLTSIFSFQRSDLYGLMKWNESSNSACRTLRCETKRGELPRWLRSSCLLACYVQRSRWRLTHVAKKKRKVNRDSDGWGLSFSFCRCSPSPFFVDFVPFSAEHHRSFRSASSIACARKNMALLESAPGAPTGEFPTRGGRISF